MRYESERDVELRLRNSVVMGAGRPIVIASVDDIRNVVGCDLITGEHKRIRVADLDLQPASARLGYINYDDRLLFGMRKPVRRYKQGLTSENLLTFDALACPSDETFGAREGNRVSHMHSSIGRTILGEYRDIGDVFKRVRAGRVKAEAYTREWAIGMMQDELSLLYRGRLAGFVTDTSVRLLPECFFLKESLAESLCE